MEMGEVSSLFLFAAFRLFSVLPFKKKKSFECHDIRQHYSLFFIAVNFQLPIYFPQTSKM